MTADVYFNVEASDQESLQRWPVCVCSDVARNRQQTVHLGHPRLRVAGVALGPQPGPGQGHHGDGAQLRVAWQPRP